MPPQLTIKEPVTLEGVNVFNGKSNKITFLPAGDDEGISFSARGHKVKATLENAIGESRRRIHCLSLCDPPPKNKTGNVVVRKIEHPLSVCYALGIDNLSIELSDGVVPRFDYGVSGMVEALGPLRVEGNAKKRYWRMNDWVAKLDTLCWNLERTDYVQAFKSDHAIVHFEVRREHKAVGEQKLSVPLIEDDYRREVMHARTPSFMSLGSRLYFGCTGYWYGMTDKNTLLIGCKSAVNYLNRSSEHYGKDEFVRHKIVDAIGAIALAGRQFNNVGFDFLLTGHAFNVHAMKKFFKDNLFCDAELPPQPCPYQDIDWNAEKPASS